MDRTSRRKIRIWFCLGLLCLPLGFAHAQQPLPRLYPEEKRLAVRSADALPSLPTNPLPPPPTVGRERVQRPNQDLSLDQALRIALNNSEVVRVVVGGAVVNSGTTIYDPAAAATQIDAQRAKFDPAVGVSNTFNHASTPYGVFDWTQPSLTGIQGYKTQGYDLTAGVAKTNIAGGTAAITGTVDRTDYGQFNILDPESRSGVSFSYRQPLLQGGGVKANTAPIVVAQLSTEISYYQLKSALQNLVSGVIDSYWGLVYARVDVLVRTQQKETSKFSLDFAKSRKNRGLATAGEVAQAQAAYSNFCAALRTAEGAMLEREAVLRNVLGLPPSDQIQFVPTTPLSTEEVMLDWDRLVAAAETQRPDMAQLKLAVEATERSLQLARNTSLPRVDLVGVYHMSGLQGTSVTGATVTSRSGDYSDWTLGVDVSTPLGQRGPRAELRRQELTLATHRANLKQGLHNATHVLATHYRNQAQQYEVYLDFKDTRSAAELSLAQQFAEYRNNETIFLNVLQAINSWGDAVRSEAQALALYNAELSALDREAGMILDIHGIKLHGQDYTSRGPLAPLQYRNYYPQSVRPEPNEDRYPMGEGPAENAFHLENVPRPKARSADARPRDLERLPPPN